MTFWRATVRTCLVFQVDETAYNFMLIYDINEAGNAMIWSTHRDVIVLILFSTHKRRNKGIFRSLRIVCKLVTTSLQMPGALQLEP